MTAPPDVEFTAAMAVAELAIRETLRDRSAWLAECDRLDAEPLPWPLLSTGDGYPQLLRELARIAVQNALQAFRETQGIEIPADPTDPGFQVVLRMAKRATDAADAELRSKFGGKRGAHALAGKRAFWNWLKARSVEAAVQSGKPRAEALKDLTISRAAAYRAMKRR